MPIKLYLQKQVAGHSMLTSAPEAAVGHLQPTVTGNKHLYVAVVGMDKGQTEWLHSEARIIFQFGGSCPMHIYFGSY